MSSCVQLVHNELQRAVSPLPLVVRVTPLPGWCSTSSHPGMRSGNLKKYEIDNISQAVNFEPDSNRFPGKFLNVDLSHSGIGLLIGCEQKMHDFDSTFFYFGWVTDEASRKPSIISWKFFNSWSFLQKDYCIDCNAEVAWVCLRCHNLYSPRSKD